MSDNAPHSGVHFPLDDDQNHIIIRNIFKHYKLSDHTVVVNLYRQYELPIGSQPNDLSDVYRTTNTAHSLM